MFVHFYCIAKVPSGKITINLKRLSHIYLSLKLPLIASLDLFHDLRIYGDKYPTTISIRISLIGMGMNLYIDDITLELLSGLFHKLATIIPTANPWKFSFMNNPIFSV